MEGAAAAARGRDCSAKRLSAAVAYLALMLPSVQNPIPTTWKQVQSTVLHMQRELVAHPRHWMPAPEFYALLQGLELGGGAVAGGEEIECLSRVGGKSDGYNDRGELESISDHSDHQFPKNLSSGSPRSPWVVESCRDESTAEAT